MLAVEYFTLTPLDYLLLVLWGIALTALTAYLRRRFF
jgi:hypothetical protein